MLRPAKISGIIRKKGGKPVEKNMQTGKRIQARREELGLNLGDIAQKVGVAVSTIQRYEKGKIEKIKLPVIEAIAKALAAVSYTHLNRLETNLCRDRLFAGHCVHLAVHHHPDISLRSGFPYSEQDLPAKARRGRGPRGRLHVAFGGVACRPLAGLGRHGSRRAHHRLLFRHHVPQGVEGPEGYQARRLFVPAGCERPFLVSSLSLIHI